MTRSTVVVVGDGRQDPLVPELTDRLARAGIPTLVVAPGDLGVLKTRATATSALVNGVPIGAVVFRAAPSSVFADQFIDDDIEFASAETRAVWLHVLSLPSVYAVNRADCDTWFASSEWSVWRSRLKDARVPATTLTVGSASQAPASVWLQWSGGLGTPPEAAAARCFAAASAAPAPFRQLLWCNGDVIGGDSTDSVAAAEPVLARYGVVLASLQLDERDHISAVTGFPRVAAADAAQVAERLVEGVHGHMAGR